MVPSDNKVFRIAQYGTVRDLEVLFASGLASPYDRDTEFGYTLLHVSNGIQSKNESTLHTASSRFPN